MAAAALAHLRFRKARLWLRFSETATGRNIFRSHEFSLSLGNPLAKNFSVNFTAQKYRRFALPARQFQHFSAETHWNYPRENFRGIRYRFHLIPARYTRFENERRWSSP